MVKQILMELREHFLIVCIPRHDQCIYEMSNCDLAVVKKLVLEGFFPDSVNPGFFIEKAA